MKKEKAVSTVEVVIAQLREKADNFEKQAQNARYNNDKQGENYFIGQRQGILTSCLEIERALHI